MVVFCLDLVSYVVILTDFSGNFTSSIYRQVSIRNISDQENSLL